MSLLSRVRGMLARMGQRSDVPTSRDVLFEAQLPFFLSNLGTWFRGLDRPDGDGPYVFRCAFGPKLPIEDFRRAVCEQNWGAFVVKDIQISATGRGGQWVHARVLVDLAQS